MFKISTAPWHACIFDKFDLYYLIIFLRAMLIFKNIPEYKLVKLFTLIVV